MMKNVLRESLTSKAKRSIMPQGHDASVEGPVRWRWDLTLRRFEGVGAREPRMSVLRWSGYDIWDSCDGELTLVMMLLEECWLLIFAAG